MHIIKLTYKVSLSKIDQHLSDHSQYLDKQYALGNFYASGRMVPRTGGVILSKIDDKEILLDIITQDPFHKHDLADYELIQFIPSKTSEELSFLMNDK